MLQVLAKPGAKSNGITGIEEEGVGVQINARPVDGEANSELVNYISKVFGLKKSEISLEKVIKTPITRNLIPTLILWITKNPVNCIILILLIKYLFILY